MAPEQQAPIHYIHRIRYSTQEKIVGLFVLLALLLFFLLFVSNSKTTHLFDDYIRLHIYVNNAEGIASDTPVRISGIEVGKVDQVEIAPDNRILIIVRVYDRYRSLLRSDSSAAIGKLSLLGRSSIEISAGSPELALLDDGAVLIAEEPLSFEQLIVEITPVVYAVEEAAKHFAEVMAAIDANKLDGLMDNLLQASEDIQQISTQLSSGQGALGMALYDEQFQQHLAGSVSKLEATLHSAEQRLQQLEPTLQHVEHIGAQSSLAADQLPGLMTESTLLVANINTSLTSLNMEIKQLPDLINRMNMLMEQTDRLLEGISNSWLFSSDEAERSQLIGVQPHE